MKRFKTVVRDILWSYLNVAIALSLWAISYFALIVIVTALNFAVGDAIYSRVDSDYVAIALSIPALWISSLAAEFALGKLGLLSFRDRKRNAREDA